MSAGSIVVDLLMKTGSFETDTQRAEKALNKLKREASNASSVMGDAFKGLAAGIAAGFTVDALVTFTKNTIDAMDALNDLADATGASIENISALEDVANRTGTSIDSVGTALVKFNSVLSDAEPGSKYAEILKGIGLNAEELKRMDPAQALHQTAIALAAFADDGNKARIIQELFGKSVKEVAPFLKDLAEKTELVGTTTGEQAGQAEAFNKQMFEMKTNVNLAARSFMSDLLPALTSGTAEFIKIAKEAGAAQAALILLGGVIARTIGTDQISQLNKQLKVGTLQAESYGRQLETALSMPFGLGENAAKSIRGKLEAQMAENARASELLKSLVAPTPAASPDAPRPSAPGLPSTEKPPTAAAAKVSEAQRYLETMTKQLQAARDLSVEEKLLEDIQAGRLDGMTPRLEAQLLTVARQLDAAKEMDQFEKAMWDFQKDRDKEKKDLEDEELKRKKALTDAGKAVYDATRTPMEALNIELERLVELLGAGAIGWDTYTRAADAASKRTLDALSKANEDDYWGKWLEGAQTALTSFDKLGGDVLNNFSSSFGNAFESMIFDSQSLGDAISGLAEGMARSIVNALGQMAAQWVAYKLVQMVVGESMQAAGAASMVSTAAATSLQAGIAAFASTAAIPIVGPALAPAAMTAAFAATAPMVAGIAALSGARATGGPVGADKTYLVGERGPELFTPNSAGAIIPNDKIGGGGNVTVNLIEDNRKAGKTEERTNNGKREMDVFVADIMGDGPRGKAIQKAFGLQRRGY